MRRRFSFLLLSFFAVCLTSARAESFAVDLVELKDSTPVNEYFKKRLRISSPLVFEEELPVKCVIAPCPPPVVAQRFAIADIRPLECGSRRVIAFATADDLYTDERAPDKMEIIDHTDRYCHDLRPYALEITISNEFGEVRHFGGNPNLAIQSEKE
ncbi:MAG: hypothetical protein H6617_02820 [Bdellovibrionaceae bacterium]|nr:hypothetical protein [Bdellovibrionales bacterium]MCB9253594.1 hypothetical protein [Pseudobdellovibrionaceae bacterium]